MKNALFAAWLKSYRERQRITQAQLAVILDVTVQTVSNWESGRNVPHHEDEIRERLEPRRSIVERICA